MVGNGSLLGIMVSNRKARKSVLFTHLRHNTTSMNLFCFTPDDIDWERKRITGLRRSKGKWVVRDCPFPQVIYNRCYELKQETIERLEAVIGSNKCFNHINHLHKYETHNRLSRWLVSHLPETVPYDAATAANMLTKHKLIYLKPCYGNKGLGVYRAELTETGEIHIGDHYLQPKIVARTLPEFRASLVTLLGDTPYIIQRGIDTKRLSGRIFDIRVLVQKNMAGEWSATSAISRVACEGCFNTSIFEKMCLTSDALAHMYPAPAAQDVLRFVKLISLRAAKILEHESGLHLGELSVDLALDRDGHPWIIEVNGKPDKGLYRGFRTNGSVYKRPLEYASFLQHS